MKNLIFLVLLSTVAGCSSDKIVNPVDARIPAIDPVTGEPTVKRSIISESRVFLDNGRIRLGVSLQAGGAITYLAEVGKPNLVNIFDHGREIQTSLYSGPTSFSANGQRPTGVYAQSSWNPVQAGDWVGTPSQVVEFRKIDSTSLYVKTIPMQWSLIKVPTECIMEHWYELRGNTVRYRSLTKLNRSDTAFYDGAFQESPAIFLNAPYYRFVAYNGNRPYSSGPLTERTSTTLPLTMLTSEPWAAVVDKNGYGLGLYHAKHFCYNGNYLYPKSVADNEFSDATTYFTNSPIHQLDHNGEYAFDCLLIPGTLDQIRQTVYALPRVNTLPEFDFDTDRQGWAYFNTRDQGWPIRNGMNIQWEGNQAGRFRAASPNQTFAAAEVPTIYIQAAFSVAANVRTARFVWHIDLEGDFPNTPNRTVEFPVISDGQKRVYVLDMKSQPGWQGYVKRVGLEATAPDNARRGRSVRLYSLTATRP
jgi:hypothetical protein